MTLGLLADGVLAILLLVTIGYCALVHKRLGAIRKAESAMRGLADDLNTATARAESGLNQLRATAAEAAEGFDPLMREARSLAGDLDMLCHRARKLADRLDPPAAPATVPTKAPQRTQPRAQKPAQKTAQKLAKKPAPKPIEAAPAKPLRATRSRSERALVEALRAAR